MLNCHHATRLMSEAQERSLSRKERWELRFHKAICTSCRRFETQLHELRTFAARFSGRNEGMARKNKKP